MVAELVDYFIDKPAVGIGYQIGFGSTKQLSPPYSFGTPHTTYTDLPQRDPVIRLMRGVLLHRGLQDVRSCISFSDPAYIPPSVGVPGLRPDTGKYSGSLDQALYSSLISNIRNMHRSILTHDPSFTKEHNVSHGNLVGKIRPAYYPGCLYVYKPVTRLLEGVSFDKELYRQPGTYRPARKESIQVTSPGGVFTFAVSAGPNSNTSFPTYPWYHLTDWLEKLAALGSWWFTLSNQIHGAPPSWSEFYGVSNFNVLVHPHYGGFSFEYDYFCSRTQGGNPNPLVVKTRQENWHITQDFVIVDQAQSSWSSTTGSRAYTPTPLVRHYYTVVPGEQRIERFNGTIEYLPAFPKTVDLMEDNTGGGACFTHDVTSGASMALANLESLDLRTQAEVFHRRVEAVLGHLTPSTYYSSAKALEDFLEVLKTNYLEFFKEAGELVALIPDVGLLFKALLDIRHLRLDGVLRLGDFLADTYLKYQFGAAPTVQAIQELNEKGPLIQKRIASILNGELRVLHGKFEFDLNIPGYPSDSPVHLVARSKLIVRMTDESFFRTLVGLKAAGLLPSLSQLWECLPLSFIVDWFTNMQRRYADIDTQFFFLCVDVKHAVHSVTLYRSVDEELLDEFSFENVAYDPVKTKSFHRHVSLAMPSLRDSMYDFRGTNPRPSAGVGGSLAWVFSR